MHQLSLTNIENNAPIVIDQFRSDLHVVDRLITLILSCCHGNGSRSREDVDL